MQLAKVRKGIDRLHALKGFCFTFEVLSFSRRLLARLYEAESLIEKVCCQIIVEQEHLQTVKKWIDCRQLE